MSEKRPVRSSCSILLVVATTLTGLETHASNEIFDLAYEEAAGQHLHVIIGEDPGVIGWPGASFGDDLSLAESNSRWGDLVAVGTRKKSLPVPLPLSGMLLGTGFVMSILLGKGISSHKNRFRIA